MTDAVAPASKAAIRAAADLAIRRPSFVQLQERLRREALTAPARSVRQDMLLENWPHTFLDANEEADPGRLRVREIVEESEPDDEIVSMATIERSPDWRSVRTFSGKRNVEVSIMPCPKSRHLLHVEGATAESFVIREQVSHATIAIATEAMRIRWPGGGHDPDVVLFREGGGMVVREIKRDEDDLRDPAKRRGIAIGAEVLRRIGIDYRIVYRREIFAGIRHRRNAHLFASRGFAHVSRPQLDALDDRLAARGAEATWGELVALLGPDDRIGAVASAQALVVRRRVSIDLTQRVHDDLPVVLHHAPTIH